jgi:hypothetical protein
MGVTVQQIFQLHLDSALRSISVSHDMLKAAHRLRDCRTQAMGSHIRHCPHWHVASVEPNSCKHRFCGQCNILERERWLHRWKQRLLPCPHHHVVFTVPHELLHLWRYNKRLFATLLFAAASQALRELLLDPKYCGARVGLLAALHTWSQTLAAHVHLHVLVSAGGLDVESGCWKPTNRDCLLPRKVLMLVFRGKFRAMVLQSLSSGELRLPPGKDENYWRNELNRLGRMPWNVKVFGRYRHGRAVAKYLACYLRGGPIGNSRLISCDGKSVIFRSRVPTQEVADRDRQTVTKLSTAEFIGRFLEHVPERGMQTVRGYGLYSGNQHSRLADAFIALGHQPPTPQQDILDVALWLEGIGRDPSSHACPVCGSPLEVIRLPRRVHRAVRAPPPPSNVAVSQSHLTA